MSDPRLDTLFDEAPVLSRTAVRGELFLPESHLRLLEKLEHLGRYSHFLLVVIGQPGSGKTTLAEQLRPDDDQDELRFALIEGGRGPDVAAVAQQLVQALDGDPEEVALAGGAEPWLLAELERLGELAVPLLIAVDDAQQLPEESLDWLIGLQERVAEPDHRPHLALFGTPELSERLLAPRYRTLLGSRAHIMTLEPLSADEMAALVRHRYGAEAELLGDAGLQRLYRESFGLPGRVSATLERILSGRKQEGGGKAKRAARKAPSWSLFLAGGAAGLLLLVAGVFWWTAEAPEGERVQVRLAPPAPAVESRVPPEPAPVAPLEERLEEVRKRLEAERREPVVEAQPPASADQPPEVSPPVEVAREESASAEPTPVIPAPEQAAPPVPEVVKKVAPVTTPGTRPLQLPPPAAAEVTPAPVPDLPVEPAVRYSADEKAILAWPPQAYTLQLLGARSEKSVQDFMQSLKLDGPLYRFDTRYKGGPWHVVIYGHYPDRKAAVAAINNLPASIRKRRPWARSVAGIQEEIRRQE